MKNFKRDEHSNDATRLKLNHLKQIYSEFEGINSEKIMMSLGIIVKDYCGYYDENYRHKATALRDLLENLEEDQRQYPLFKNSLFYGGRKTIKGKFPNISLYSIDDFMENSDFEGFDFSKYVLSLVHSPTDGWWLALGRGLSTTFWNHCKLIFHKMNRQFMVNIKQFDENFKKIVLDCHRELQFDDLQLPIVVIFIIGIIKKYQEREVLGYF